MCTTTRTSATNAIIPIGDLTNHNSKPLPTLRKKFVAFENNTGDQVLKQRDREEVIVEVSWCSFYLISRIFGLFLVLTGLILVVMVALGDNNPSNPDTNMYPGISDDDNTNMHTTKSSTFFQRLSSPMQPRTSVNSQVSSTHCCIAFVKWNNLFIQQVTVLTDLRVGSSGPK